MLAVVPLYNNKHQRKDLWLTESADDGDDFQRCGPNTYQKKINLERESK